MSRMLLIVATLAVSGCASTGRNNQFRQFADVGRSEQLAVGKVVDQALASNIDANSRELLDARDQLVAARGWGNLDPDALLERANRSLMVTTQNLVAIKRHAALLDQYFQSVAALADYDSSAIATSTEATVGALTALAPRLRSLSAGGVALPSASGSLAPVVVNGVRSHSLERELRAHAVEIDRELEMQERLLLFLSKMIEHDQELLAQNRIAAELAVPYADLARPISAGWMASRRDILLAQALAPEPAAQASEIAARMRLSFHQLCQGRANADDIASYASDLSRLLTLLELVSGHSAGAGK